MDTAAARLTQAARTFRAALAAFEPAHVPGSECARVADELAATEKACAATRLVASARAVAHGSHRQAGFADAAVWIARQGGTTTTQARQALELARSLDAHPETREALLAGSVSVAQAHEITRAEDEAPGQEAALLSVAKGGDLSTLRDEVRSRRVERTPPEALHRLQLRARRFRHWRDGIGMVCFEGALPPETGIPLVNRIELAAQRARRRATHKHRDDHGAEDGTPERFEAYAADALVALTAGGSEARGPRTELVIVCDLFAYRRGHAHDGERCQLIGGGPIPVSLAKELSAGDAFVKAVLHDGITIHTVKHFGRHLRAELRTALDLGPVPEFTGRQCQDCGRRYGLEYDHVDPVANHGPTSYDNMQARCYADHQAKTERDRAAGLLGARARRAALPPPPAAGPRTRPAAAAAPTAPSPPVPQSRPRSRGAPPGRPRPPAGTQPVRKRRSQSPSRTE